MAKLIVSVLYFVIVGAVLGANKRAKDMPANSPQAKPWNIALGVGFSFLVLLFVISLV